MAGSFSVPVVQRLKVRWLDEMEQRDDIVMANGQPTAAKKNEIVKTELRIRLGFMTGSQVRGYLEPLWLADSVPAMAPYEARPAAGTLIGPDSVFRKLADALLVLAGTDLVPAGVDDGVGVPLVQDITSMEVVCPINAPHERFAQISIREYLDADKKIAIGNNAYRWESRSVRSQRGMTTGKALEDLFLDPSISTHLATAVAQCGALSKALLPTVLVFDQDEWLARLEDMVLALTGGNAS